MSARKTFTGGETLQINYLKNIFAAAEGPERKRKPALIGPENRVGGATPARAGRL
jgi:hypothetical protein